MSGSSRQRRGEHAPGGQQHAREAAARAAATPTMRHAVLLAALGAGADQRHPEAARGQPPALLVEDPRVEGRVDAGEVRDPQGLHPSSGKSRRAVSMSLSPRPERPTRMACFSFFFQSALASPASRA